MKILVCLIAIGMGSATAWSAEEDQINYWVKALPGQMVKPLPGQMVKALPGQVIQALPGQVVQPLPGQIVRSWPRRVQDPRVVWPVMFAGVGLY